MAEPTFKRDAAAESAAIEKGIATKEQIEEEMFRFVGNLGEFYYYMGVRYQKHQNPNRRGRKPKNI